VRWGPNFGDETPGFCQIAKSQVLKVQALAKIARSKMGRVLEKTHLERVPTLRSTISVFKEHASYWANTIIAIVERSATTILGRGGFHAEALGARR
jgi:hypothetical protein